MPTATRPQVVEIEPLVGTNVDGNHVVDFQVLRIDHALVEAVLAIGMPLDVDAPHLPPTFVVAALRRGAASFVRPTMRCLTAVLIAEPFPRRVGTTGMAAAGLELGGHANVLRGRVLYVNPFQAFYLARHAVKDRIDANHSQRPKSFRI